MNYPGKEWDSLGEQRCFVWPCWQEPPRSRRCYVLLLELDLMQAVVGAQKFFEDLQVDFQAG
jgi:hypothetical protein